MAEEESAEATFNFDACFFEYYERTARIIGRVIRDPARAEELAVEVFWKLWRHPKAQGDKAPGWLRRTAVRAALNELRREERSRKYESLVEQPPATLTPEQAHAAAEEQQQVRAVLAAMHVRKAELLLMRSDGLSYDELASALGMNPKSVGTQLGRAQEAFRKEYSKRYGRRKN